jgi:hypothetical protein
MGKLYKNNLDLLSLCAFIQFSDRISEYLRNLKTFGLHTVTVKLLRILSYFPFHLHFYWQSVECRESIKIISNFDFTILFNFREHKPTAESQTR